MIVPDPDAHVVELANAHDVKVWVCENADLDVDVSQAQLSEPRAIFLAQRPSSSTVAYFVALHELGHHAAHPPVGALKLDCEARAWRWALEQADWPPSAADCRAIYDRLTSYLNDGRYRVTEEFTELVLEIARKAGLIGACQSLESL